jgi:hypothetical protein
MRRVGLHITLVIFLCTICIVSVTGQNQPSYKIDRLNINSPDFSDIAPVIFRDGLIFCSNRKNSILRDNRTWDDNRVYNIYFAGKEETGRFTNPRLFSGDLASEISEGPLCFSPDGNRVYFTRNIKDGKAIRRKNQKNLQGIFIADRQGDNWVNIRPFEHNNPDYNVGHPALSKDGRILYFSSDMPGGKGKSDIWYSEERDGRWGEPVNAGRINSADAELYLSMHYSGRLYFSSDRPPLRPGSFGGLNIYYTLMTEDGWIDPLMLAEPINSEADDFAFTAYDDGQSGYFTSTRRKYDDLYSFVSVIIRKDDCNPQEENSFCYEFYEVNAVVYDTIPFEFEWDFGDGNRKRGVRTEHCFDGPGTYIVRLNSVNLITGEEMKNEATIELVIELIEQPYITGPDTVTVGEMVQFNAGETHLPGWDIDRYYWNFGDETIAEGSLVPKTFVMPGVFDMQLIVSTPPDSNGVMKESCVTKKVVVVRRP